MNIDHVGIAVRSLEEASSFYKNLGWDAPETEVVSEQKVKVGFFRCENGSDVELLEPTGPDSPVAKFIEKRGEGMHHICFRVKDIRAQLAKLQENGVPLIDKEPRKGAHGKWVAFVHPKATGGVLVELSQSGGS
jgi:methylmalonyl-CoA/ethylmalonyl-CoA epimerase